MQSNYQNELHMNGFNVCGVSLYEIATFESRKLGWGNNLSRMGHGPYGPCNLNILDQTWGDRPKSK